MTPASLYFTISLLWLSGRVFSRATPYQLLGLSLDRRELVEGVYVPPTVVNGSSESCPGSDWNACASGLPANFCCSSTDICITLSSNTTALCCPKGADCSTISPIPCDLQLQNATSDPSTPIMTTELNGSLPTCGKNTCCPFGYRCESNTCIMKDNQIPKTTTTGPATTSTSSRAQTQETTTAAGTTAGNGIARTSPVVLPTATQDSEASNKATTESSSSASSSGNAALVIGATCAVCSLAGVVLFLWLRWKRKKFFAQGGKSVSWQHLHSPPLNELSGLSPPQKATHLSREPLSLQTAEQRHVTKAKPILVEHEPGQCFAVELPATPVSFSFWNRDKSNPPARPQSRYNPYQGTQGLQKWAAEYAKLDR